MCGSQSAAGGEGTDPDAMKAMAKACRDRGDRLEAIRLLQRAVDLDPDDADAHFLLGDALDECDEDAPRALQAYDRSLELAPSNPMTLAQRGMVLRRMGRVDEALDDYRKGLALDPHHLVTLSAMCGAWLLEGRTDLAASCLALIRPSDLEVSPPLLSRVTRWAVHLGTLLAQEERWLEAARQFEVACGLSPGDVDCCFNHAMCLFHADAYADALARLRHVLTLDPGHERAGQLQARFEEAAGQLRDVSGFGPLLASFSLHTIHYRNSFGLESTMFNVLVKLETQTRFVRLEQDRLSLASDRILLDLLLAKGHNARVQGGVEGRPMVFAVSVEPDPDFLAFAACSNWTTSQGLQVESAPVAVLLAPHGIPERSLLPGVFGPFRLHRTLELERDRREYFYPEEYCSRS